MKRLFFCLFISVNVFAALGQNDSLLKTYFVHSQFDEKCSADVALTLFSESADQDLLNENILAELMKGYYNTHSSWVTLKNLYANKSFPPSREFLYTIAGSCSFHKNDIYSFSACPYSVCDKNVYSTFESNAVNIDLRTQQILSLYDVIDPAKKDSFEKYVYFTATRYKIKNIPSCYVTGFSPIQTKGSCGVVLQNDTINYLKGVTNKFYLRDNYMFVYNKAQHRSYTYDCVEVMFMLPYLRYFLRPDMADRLLSQ